MGAMPSSPIDAFAKHCLIEGVDEPGKMLKQEPAITAYEAGHPGLVNKHAGAMSRPPVTTYRGTNRPCRIPDCCPRVKPMVELV